MSLIEQFNLEANLPECSKNFRDLLNDFPAYRQGSRGCRARRI
jgi:hypothetical protein